MIEFFIIPILYVLGLIFILALGDRYWGLRFLGNLVPPRSKIIYEGRPWWMKNVALLIVMGILGTVIIVMTYWIMPYTLETLMTGIGLLWAIILIGSVIAAVFRNKEKSTHSVEVNQNNSK